MAELSDVISTVEKYRTSLNNLNSQIDSIKGYLSDMGINVDTVKVSDLMKYFSNDNYNHSIEPNIFTLNNKKCTTTLPLTADLVNEGLKFRNPSNPSEILTGTYKPYAATAIFTFNLKDLNQSEASFSFNYPELIGQPDVTVYPKEIVEIGISSLPGKIDYVYGEALDLTGLVITAYYEDGTYEDIADYVVSGFDGSVGVNTVYIQYGKFRLGFDVTVGE